MAIQDQTLGVWFYRFGVRDRLQQRQIQQKAVSNNSKV